MGRRRRRIAVSAAAVVALAGCGGVARRPLTGAATATPVVTTIGTGVATTTTTAAAGLVPTATGGAATAASPSTTAARPAVTTPAATTVTTPVATTGTAAPACGATLAAQLADTGGGTQLITVVAATTGSTSATVTLWQRIGGCWTQAAGPWTGRVGYNGLSAHHHEGDGTTPSGLYAIGSSFYGLARDPGVHGRYHPLVCGDWWDEDPASPQYNTFQHIACGATPAFGGGSEQLWTQTTAYESFAVVDYNTGPVVAGAGSAIFIHDDTGGSTNGCVSLPPAALDNLLRWLRPGQSPHIAVGTTSTIALY